MQCDDADFDPRAPFISLMLLIREAKRMCLDGIQRGGMLQQTDTRQSRAEQNRDEANQPASPASQYKKVQCAQQEQLQAA